MSTVALVDDDSIFQFTATRMIESAHLADNILHFINGAEALRYLDENSSQPDKLPDYLFLDINMPLVDGWMFLDDLAKIKSNLSKEFPIYMVSSSIDPRDINRSKDYHEIKDFVIKPVSLERFTKLLSY